MRPFLPLLLLALIACGRATAQMDSDADGLSDETEQALLNQFSPAFMVARADCSLLPAQFEPGLRTPTVAREDGTIYGQAFPSRHHPGSVELHFYHLWRTDCGPHGHPLDTEHVATLVRFDGTRWQAVYWYAAAHEKTVCDVSQIARASTLKAVDQGAKVWISPGKHASYLNETLCRAGCGADRCVSMTPLKTERIVNLGEAAKPMNGSVFLSASAWPLSEKMTQSNFPPATLARLEALPTTDIAWFSPGRHPMQGVIAISATTEEAIGTGGRNTSSAISIGKESTGNALGKSYRKTIHALGTSAHHVGKALGVEGAKQTSPE